MILDEAIGFADANIAGAEVLKLKRENPDPARTTIVDDNEMKRDLGDLNPLIGMIDDLDFKKRNSNSPFVTRFCSTSMAFPRVWPREDMLGNGSLMETSSESRPGPLGK